jgi:hypothetical protein
MRKLTTGLLVTAGVAAIVGAIAISDDAQPRSFPATGWTAGTILITPTPPAESIPAEPLQVSSPGTLRSGLYHAVTSPTSADEMQAGATYHTAGPETGDLVGSCYWAKRKDDSGDFAAILANGNTSGVSQITLKAGQYLELNGSCTWTK